jgi:uncharacterized protein (DUF427 family)
MDDATALTKRRKDSPHGAGHYHVTDRYPFRVRALIGGVEVANSDQVRILKEVGGSVYNPVLYFPPGDVDLTQFERDAGFTTECPIKGTASYWRYAGAAPVERVAWSYDTPLAYSQMIADHLAFDQRHVTLEISPA